MAHTYLQAKHPYTQNMCAPPVHKVRKKSSYSLSTVVAGRIGGGRQALEPGPCVITPSRLFGCLVLRSNGTSGSFPAPLHLVFRWELLKPHRCGTVTPSQMRKLIPKELSPFPEVTQLVNRASLFDLHNVCISYCSTSST